MKNKDLFRLINEAAEKDLPAVFERIPLDKIEIVTEAEPLKKPRFTFQRVLIYSLASLLVFIGLFWAMTKLSSVNVPNYTPLETETEIIGYQTLSATTLLESIDPLKLHYSLLSSTDTPSKSAISSEIDTINAYINMLEITLGSENELTYTLQGSDNIAYETMISFQGQGLAGEDISYRFYYNVHENDGKRVYQGVITFLEDEYIAAGEISLDETATVRSTFKIEIDTENYVEIDDVSTTANQIFSYRIVQSSETKNASMIKLHTTKRTLRAEISYASHGKNLKFEVEKNRAQKALSIRYEISDGETENGTIDVGLVYDEEQSVYSYRYRVHNASGTAHGEYQGKRRRKSTTAGGDGGGASTEEDEGNDSKNSKRRPGNRNPGHGNFI
ncbi:MAG: hypothetical protein GX904_03305 [Acholeplasmataceae bacterium]|nr:hypothetical protein [Acholeplasmataceae bacterium]